MDDIQVGETITESPAVEEIDEIESLIADIKNGDDDTGTSEKNSGEPEKEEADNPGIIEEEEEIDESSLPEGLKKRLSKLTGKNKDLEKELEHYKTIAEQIPPQIEVNHESQELELPDPDSYEEGTFDRNYQADIHNYYVESAKRELLLAQQKAVEQNKINQHYNGIKAKVESAIAANPELGKMMAEVTNVSPLFTELVHSSQHLQRLVEYFHANKEKATQISMMSPQDTMREIIRLELAFDSKPTIKTTNAPDPVKKLKTSGSGISKSILDENLSDDELFRMI